jgi:nucleoside-diphosphate-sugar epimerase
MAPTESTTPRILIIGAQGQIGQDLTIALRQTHGPEQVIAADIRPASTVDGPSVVLDATDENALRSLVQKYQINHIYHLAAILSAKGEQQPALAWDLNMKSLLNVLEVARQEQIAKVFWPSSIAIFGSSTPKDQTPQATITDPNTVYGISKLAGERWCEYYWKNHGVDVRSVRFPGLISYRSMPGGGTTDYAVDIFHAALREGRYTSFLQAGTYLPMLYMPDAVRAMVQLMEAPASAIRVRSSYNLGGLSFAPEELAAAIKQKLPQFHMTYQPDFRQAIADTWPNSLDDQVARQDWGWQPSYDLPAMVSDMLFQLEQQLAIKQS